MYSLFNFMNTIIQTMSTSQRNSILIFLSLIFCLWLAGPLSLVLLIIFYCNHILVAKYDSVKLIETKTYLTMGIIFINIVPMVFAKNFLHMIDGMLPFSGGIVFFPIGISYISFRGLSYYFDVAYKKIQPVAQPSELFLYLFFFPTYICGPVERARVFLPQIHEKYELPEKNIHSALFLISSGFVLKFFLADTIAGLLVNDVFHSPLQYSSPEIWAAVYGYSAKIFFDFAGYTNMALGIALLFGFNVMDNFNSPYHAVSIADFWRRWHISLSSWLMESIFTPLQLTFRRAGQFGTAAAILITFFLCAVWHDAGIAMIIWGMIHGVCMLPSLLKNSSLRELNHNTGLKIFFTFQIVTFAWIFFRAYSLDDAMAILGGMVGTSNGFQLPAWEGILLLILSYILIYFPADQKEKLKAAYNRISVKAKLAILIILIVLYLYLPGFYFNWFTYTYF